MNQSISKKYDTKIDRREYYSLDPSKLSKKHAPQNILSTNDDDRITQILSPKCKSLLLDFIF